jgi:hypothetical protein
MSITALLLSHKRKVNFLKNGVTETEKKKKYIYISFVEVIGLNIKAATFLSYLNVIGNFHKYLFQDSRRPYPSDIHEIIKIFT